MISALSNNMTITHHAAGVSALNEFGDEGYLPLGSVVDPLRDYRRQLTLRRPMLWKVLAKLQSFGNIRANWDGDGAQAIDGKVIDVAMSFIQSNADLIESPFYVVPTHFGGVQLEWVRGLRELELEFVSPDRIDYLFTDEDRGISEEASCSVTDQTFIRGLITRVNSG
ncbi:MAG: hypothetical protein AAF911_13110 [Planctomycetota bacterium]